MGAEATFGHTAQSRLPDGSLLKEEIHINLGF